MLTRVVLVLTRVNSCQYSCIRIDMITGSGQWFHLRPYKTNLLLTGGNVADLHHQSELFIDVARQVPVYPHLSNSSSSLSQNPTESLDLK